MKSASTAFKNILYSTTPFLLADLYTFTLNDGTVLRYTSCDRDIIVSGVTYTAHGLKLEKSSIKTSIGIETSEMSLRIYPASTDTIGSETFFSAVVNNLFDMATVERDIAVMSSWGNTSPGTIKSFFGYVADITISEGIITMSIKDPTELLNTYFPRNVYQTQCLNTLFDADCTKLASSYQLNTSVTNVTNRSVFASTALNTNDGGNASYFALGKLKFTSGNNSGAWRSVKSYDRTTNGGTVTMGYPFLNDIAVGDAFSIWPGCDKTANTCTNTFAQGSPPVNFRGFPLIPVNEKAY